MSNEGPSSKPALSWTGVKQVEAFMSNLIARFVRDESGATAIEYGLIAVLIAVAIIGGATALGSKLNATFNTIVTDLK
jgi:pilus assembly protein Flp/PilA